MCRPRTGGKSNQSFPRVNIKQLQQDMNEARKLLGKDYLQRLIDGTKVKAYQKDDEGSKNVGSGGAPKTFEEMEDEE